MKKIVRINENKLYTIISESVKRCLNEISYDDWKLMTPEENAGLTEEDYQITIEVATDEDKINNWSDCEIFDAVNDGDGGVVFKVTFNDSVWVGRYDDEYDTKERIDRCVYDFVEDHGGADDGYDIINWKKI